MDDSISGEVGNAQAYWQSFDAATEHKTQRIPLGLSTFNEKDRQQFGQRARLAMALMDGSGAAAPGTASQTTKANPRDVSSISQRLKSLNKDLASNLADQLELLVRFDDLQGWALSGSRHCAAWMNLELGISLPLGWEYLRAGRRLRNLPITTALFRAGQLGWSKIRLLTRVADGDNEGGLCHAALDASVSDLERLCNEYRWQEDGGGNEAEAENIRSLQQWESRSFTWNTASNGSTHIRLSLPPEIAQAFLNSVEQSLAQLETSPGTNTCTATQRRADAAVLMAETSLQSAGREMATADRYQVIVNVDASDLQNASYNNTSANGACEPENAKDATKKKKATHTSKPTRRPTILGANPIARDTARRLACDCSTSSIIHTNGEPVSIGRKSRLWPAAMVRAIKSRDQHCQFPGCSNTRHLQIHHIQHWADGGSTSVENGVCLCSRCHTLVHEGGYRIERVNNDAPLMEKQFTRQQAPQDDVAIFDVERQLRNSRESFDYVRSLSPTRYRFRVINASGIDIRDFDSTRVENYKGVEKSPHREKQHIRSKINECAGTYNLLVN